MNQRINILYLHSHDTGRYIQPYGYNVPTPNLQKFAEESVLFRQAFCVGPTCSPSRAGLLTGMYPHYCWMLGLSHRGHSLNDYSQHIVTTLKNANFPRHLSKSKSNNKILLFVLNKTNLDWKDLRIHLVHIE